MVLAAAAAAEADSCAQAKTLYLGWAKVKVEVKKVVLPFMTILVYSDVEVAEAAADSGAPVMTLYLE